MQDRSSYELIDPESVGRSRPDFVIGRHSSTRALTSAASEMGQDLSEEKAAQILPKLRDLATELGRALKPEEFINLIQSHSKAA
jgi:isopropylmalate/homocitrate/citramalate synthase